MVHLLTGLCALITLTVVHADLPENYQALDAAAKRRLLWANVSAEPYAEPPSLDGAPGPSLREIFFSGIGNAFTSATDEIASNRTKIIHKWGSVALVRFEADGLSAYTGLFRTGALGLARISLALPFRPGGDFVPGLALKLFVDGKPSVNLTVMERLEGQGPDTNVFRSTFTNVLPDPAKFATKFGTWAFERFVEDALNLRVDHLAEVERDGRAVERPRAAAQLLFVPLASVAADAADFRAELGRLEVGTALWEIYARSTLEPAQAPAHVGRVVTESPFVASAYGDRTLYFQHAGTELRSGFVSGWRR